MSNGPSVDEIVRGWGFDRETVPDYSAMQRPRWIVFVAVVWCGAQVIGRQTSHAMGRQAPAWPVIGP